MKRGRIVLDLATRTGSRAAASLMQAAILVLIARLAGPPAFGEFAIVLSIGYLVSTATSLGTSSRVLRLSAEAGGLALATSMFWLRFGAVLVSIGACLAVGIGQEWEYVLLAAVLVGSDQLIDYLQAFLAGTGRQTASSLVVFLQRAIPLAVLSAAIWLDADFTLSVTVALFLTLVASATLPLFVRTRPSSLVVAARTSAGYWASSLVVSINQLQVPLLGWVASTATAGAFAIALRIVNPLNIFIAAMQTVFVPELAKASTIEARSRSFRLLSRVALAYATALAVASPLIAEFAIVLLGEQYRPFYVLFVAMIVAAGLSGIAQAYQSRLLAQGRPGVSAWVIGVGSTVGLALLAVVAITLGESWIWVPPIFTFALVAAGMVIASRDRRGAGNG